jgi:Phage capsid family
VHAGIARATRNTAARTHLKVINPSSPSRSASPSTAARAVSSEVCPYTSPVIATEECPSRSATALMCTPASSHATAALCRKVCTPTPSTPAVFAAVLSTRSRLCGSTGPPQLSYLRQTVRTNLAAVVATGAQKPTSVYTVTRIENSLVVIAHLSEGIPRHWLIDAPALERFLDNELRYGLQTAVEAKVLSDINGTSGIQSQAYDTSVLATLRRGIQKLEVAGYTASSFVLTPAAWADVELGLASTNAIEHLALPYDPATRRLFGVPIVTTNAQAAGVGHVLASGAVALDTDNRGVDVQWSENATADSFGKNLVFASCESRYATSVFSPLGVVTLDLTA